MKAVFRALSFFFCFVTAFRLSQRCAAVGHPWKLQFGMLAALSAFAFCSVVWFACGAPGTALYPEKPAVCHAMLIIECIGYFILCFQNDFMERQMADSQIIDG